LIELGSYTLDDVNNSIGDYCDSIEGNIEIEIPQPVSEVEILSDTLQYFHSWSRGVLGASVLSDPYLSSQWGLYKIGADAAYAAGLTGAGVLVGIVDTGVQYTHPDLDDNYAGGVDFVNPGTTPMDENGHGTHVAGIICAEANDIGIRGVAPSAKFLAVRVLNSAGRGTAWNIAKGIAWANQHGADIINLSLGTTAPSQIISRAIIAAYNNGSLIVAAAGNNGVNQYTYPAAYPSVIAVSAIDKSETLAPYSNYGDFIELSAPGGAAADITQNGILSTYANNTYAYAVGTSMAAPYVSGIAALLFQQYVNATNVEIRDMLESSVKDLGTPGKDIFYGYGLIQFGATSAIPMDLALIIGITVVIIGVIGIAAYRVASRKIAG